MEPDQSGADVSFNNSKNSTTVYCRDGRKLLGRINLSSRKVPQKCLKSYKGKLFVLHCTQREFLYQTCKGIGLFKK